MCILIDGGKQDKDKDKNNKYNKINHGFIIQRFEHSASNQIYIKLISEQPLPMFSKDLTSKRQRQ